MLQGSRPSGIRAILEHAGLLGTMRAFRERLREGSYGRTSYSQTGEDLIVDYVLSVYMNIAHPTYLDIGAHHPIHLSNTYYFYKKRCLGVCVEPDPTLFVNLKKRRPKDICLNVGIGGGQHGMADFYVMSTRTLSTFSREEAARYQTLGEKVEDVIRITLMTVDDVIEKYFDSPPNFVSIDTEGVDLDILRSFDFSRHRPETFCVETVAHSRDHSGQKITDIFELMTANGYYVYADTYINTIFVDGRRSSSK